MHKLKYVSQHARMTLTHTLSCMCFLAPTFASRPLPRQVLCLIHNYNADECMRRKSSYLPLIALLSHCLSFSDTIKSYLPFNSRVLSDEIVSEGRNCDD